MTDEQIHRESLRLALYLKQFTAPERDRVIRAALRGVRGPQIAQMPLPIAEPLKLVVSKPSVELLLDAQHIISLTAQLYKVEVDALKRRDRGKQRVSEARGVAMAVLRTYFGRKLSFPTIGRLFHRDHTTVMHAVDIYSHSMEVSVILDTFRERKKEERIRSGFADAVRSMKEELPDFQPVASFN